MPGADTRASTDGSQAPFWEHPLSQWAAMMDGGARLHLVTARAVAPRMVARRRGLIVATTFWDRDHLS
jgi:NADP-dependent 3-hydroxy acid dehydrogenase YdfG